MEIINTNDRRITTWKSNYSVQPPKHNNILHCRMSVRGNVFYFFFYSVTITQKLFFFYILVSRIIIVNTLQWPDKKTASVCVCVRGIISDLLCR